MARLEELVRGARVRGVLPHETVTVVDAGPSTVTLTRNEILTALNKPEEFVLALVAVPSQPGSAPAVRYVRRPFTREPEEFAESVAYRRDDLRARG